MPQHDHIDAESLVPLVALYEAIPGGFNAIPDITTRRATVGALLTQMTADLPSMFIDVGSCIMTLPPRSRSDSPAGGGLRSAHVPKHQDPQAALH